MSAAKPRSRHRQRMRKEVYAAVADLQTSYVLEEIASRMKIKNGSFNVRFRGGFFQDLTYTLELKPEDFEKIQIDWPPTSTAPAPTEKGTSESGRS